MNRIRLTKAILLSSLFFIATSCSSETTSTVPEGYVGPGTSRIALEEISPHITDEMGDDDCDGSCVATSIDLCHITSNVSSVAIGEIEGVIHVLGDEACEQGYSGGYYRLDMTIWAVAGGQALPERATLIALSDGVPRPFESFQQEDRLLLVSTLQFEDLLLYRGGVPLSHASLDANSNALARLEDDETTYKVDLPNTFEGLVRGVDDYLGHPESCPAHRQRTDEFWRETVYGRQYCTPVEGPPRE